MISGFQMIKLLVDLVAITICAPFAFKFDNFEFVADTRDTSVTTTHGQIWTQTQRDGHTPTVPCAHTLDTFTARVTVRHDILTMIYPDHQKP